MANIKMLGVSGLYAGYSPIEANFNSGILCGLDFEILKGEVVALLGRNGSGRSTLALALMGLLPRDNVCGDILLNGKNISNLPSFDRARLGLGYVAEGREIFQDLTVYQNLLLGAKNKAQRDYIDVIFGIFERLKERENVYAGLLSGGEQQMLAIARTLVGQPDLIIVDEPAEGLAPKIVQLLGDVFFKLKNEGVAIFLIEQKMVLAPKIADRVLLMGHGKIVFEGSLSELSENFLIRKKWLEV